MIIKNVGFSILELVIVVAIIGIFASILIPENNFSYVASSIIAESQHASKPLKEEIEKYYLENNKFSNNKEFIVSVKLNKSKRVKTIELLSNGKIRIVYNTRDIKWGATWWHSWNNPLSNDLTGKDLIIVPKFFGGKLVWDECNFGSAPKRNRHYKCSGHK